MSVAVVGASLDLRIRIPNTTGCVVVCFYLTLLFLLRCFVQLSASRYSRAGLFGIPFWRHKPRVQMTR